MQSLTKKKCLKNQHTIKNNATKDTEIHQPFPVWKDSKAISKALGLH